MTKAERKKFEHKQCHMKVMTERVQNYNKVNFVPKSKQSGTDAPMPPSSLNEEELAKFRQTAEFAGITAVDDPSIPQDGGSQKEPNPKMPSKIMENLQQSNCKEIVRGMSVHDQMRLIHNIMENEEFKREQRKKDKEVVEQKRIDAEEQSKRIDKSLSEGCWGDECICSKGDATEQVLLQKQQKLAMDDE